MFGIVKKVFGTAQGRTVKRYRKIVRTINTLEEQYQNLSDDEVRAKHEEFKKRIVDGESVDALLPEAYALVKNVCRRLVGTEIHVSGYDQKWDMIPYDVQIIGAIALHNGTIAEMQTGEGKTLTAALPLYLNALTGKPVHLVTVNDYLAKRDCEWVGEIFRYLGMTAVALTNDVPPQERKERYKSDIVYGTASEFGFDYLRDNSMTQNADDQVQCGFYFAIIDEVDSILIDEARTPLIISGPSGESRHMYDTLKGPIARIVRIQRDQCNSLATEARKTFDKLGLLSEEASSRKLSKEENQEAIEAYKKLWLVGKGTPQNKVLRRLKEHPDIRAQLEKWETHFYGDANKEERAEMLAKLHIIVDERASEYELTDKGIHAWAESEKEATTEDFVMLDLGYEYATIDNNASLSDEEKLKKKVELREEDSLRKEKVHNLRQLFRAHLLMERDVDYIVQEGKIVIIDENTGRPQPGRRFSDGLHQSIEAKESVAIQQETQTYATITLQNYFRMYDKLSGMTGTAMTEAAEFKEIYKIDVLEVPTHKKCIRDDADDEIYMTEREKYSALLKEITELHEQGRPILIGTESVEISEKLSRILKQAKLKHSVLNAKNHATEAETIAHAGKRGAITVATSMAGRGTDIKLEEGVAELGGLHVIGTTRHQSRRIDRQLRGRCARQGDPGSSKFYVSFEDSLMRLFTSPKLTTLLQRFRPPEGEPISAKMLNKSIETAQKRVEQRNYSMRKHTLEYDDVMNKQRQELYAFRNMILTTEDPIQLGYESLYNSCQHLSGPEAVMTNFPITIHKDFEGDVSQLVITAFKFKLDHQANLIALVQEASGSEVDPVSVLRDIVRSILLRSVDRHWQNHLLAIDHLRSEVNLRAIGQKDPLTEFKHEAFELFSHLNEKLDLDISHTLFKFEMAPPQSKELRDSIKRVQTKALKPYFSEKLLS